MKDLKTIQEEELKKFKHQFLRTVPAHNPYWTLADVEPFLLSAMETSAKGAEDNILEYLKDKLEKGHELKTVVESLEANLFVRRATKAKDYMEGL